MTRHLANTPLSDDEYEALDELLGAPALDGRAMDVSMLEGFLAAVAMGPNMVMPDQWLPWVWDRELGVGGMAAVSIDDVNRANSLVMRHYNHMATWLREDPGSFEPIFECGPAWGAAEWCEGFLVGLRLDKMGWAPLMVSHMDLFAPMNGLAAQLVAASGAGASPLEAGATEEEIDEWTVAVAPSVVKINALLAVQRRKQASGKADAAQRPTVREVPKVGRNDPCHCGSGKKFKKCCGAE